jgi:hypothetical protein
MWRGEVATTGFEGVCCGEWVDLCCGWSGKLGSSLQELWKHPVAVAAAECVRVWLSWVIGSCCRALACIRLSFVEWQAVYVMWAGLWRGGQCSAWWRAACSAQHGDCPAVGLCKVP